MTAPDDAPLDRWSDAVLAARLCAIDPRLGGVILRGGGDARDAVVAALTAALPAGAPVRRVPLHIDSDRLLGGIDLSATLASGRPVSQRGLLAEADGGLVILPMAERIADTTASAMAAAIDTGVLIAERDGVALHSPATFVTVALDDGRDDDDRPAAALADRIAFWFDLPDCRTSPIYDTQERAISVDVAPPTPDMMEAIAATTIALGIASARAPLLALRAARASARLDGRAIMTEADLAIAARLVLGPRATTLPPLPEAEPAEQPATPPPPSDAAADGETTGDPKPIEDVVLEAAMASLPPDLLAAIAAGGARRLPQAGGQGRGAKQRVATRGRPVGVRAGIPRGGLRLSLIDTLRAAAPWQRLRDAPPGRVRIRRDDLRIRRFEKRQEATTIFAVDASGSSAVARLAEAKGAVELLLAEAYVKRAQVALIAFRGVAAELILPPTRSLTRARKALAALPGGGGTPLAAGLTAARALADAARKRGRTPFVVVLTDGRANVAADGAMVRGVAEADADSAARAIGADGVRSAFVDISARPRPEGARIAALMRARYLPLPRANARSVHAAVREAQDAR